MKAWAYPNVPGRDVPGIREEMGLLNDQLCGEADGGQCEQNEEEWKKIPIQAALHSRGLDSFELGIQRHLRLGSRVDGHSWETAGENGQLSGDICVKWVDVAR